MQTRYTAPLALHWRFSLGDHDNAWLKGFDDTQWQTVTVPHDWSVEAPFSPEHSSGTGYLPGGIGYYRKAFPLDESLRGRVVTLTFDGVYNNASVWINSYYLGSYPYGYSEFSFDITPFCTFGTDENVIVVKVAHRDIADSRWFTGSGIYRKVTVTAQAPLHIGQHSPFIRTERADQSTACLAITTDIQNSAPQESTFLLEQTLFQGDQSVASVAEEIFLEAGEAISVDQALQVDKPRLWSPDHPDLYTCLTTLKVNGQVMDQCSTVTGIRTFYFDGEKGFFLNGENMKIKGVCVHHDAGCLGAAVRPKVWRRRLKQLKALGCNGIRMSHNPHMPELYDLCDELGFLVMDEAFDEWEGVKNKWSTGHNVYPPKHYGYAEHFPQWHEQDLSAMVLRDRNHPSVILWSIGNEIDYPNDPYCHPLFNEMVGNNDSNKPEAERMYNPAKPNAQRLITIGRKLVEIVKRHDTSRPVTSALAFPELSTRTGLNELLDVVGYNYKEHLYPEDHQRFPGLPLLGSENGKLLEQWEAVEQNDYISGQFLWTGIDFLGETRGWPSHGSKAGLLDMAGFRKPIGDFRAALWCTEPMAALYTRPTKGHIEETSWDPYRAPIWDYPAGTEVQVFCYTNGVEAELFLDDRSLGIKRPLEEPGRVPMWTVPYAKGILKVVTRDKEGRRAEAILQPIGAPCAIQLQVSDEMLHADGMDMAHVEISLVDSQGNRVVNGENMLYVSVEGGQLMGLENGCQEDTQPYALPYRRAYNGRLLLYVGAPEEPGDIRIRVTGERLLGAQAMIRAERVM